MSDWLTDEFTATALVAIADATRKCSKAKDIALLIKAHMEHHYDGAWQVIVGKEFARQQYNAIPLPKKSVGNAFS
ncbi:hypothetical protein ACTXT7_012447 [Hymenolepis weldensis]